VVAVRYFHSQHVLSSGNRKNQASSDIQGLSDDESFIECLFDGISHQVVNQLSRNDFDVAEHVM
jgi:hypothetical protein